MISRGILQIFPHNFTKLKPFFVDIKKLSNSLESPHSNLFPQNVPNANLSREVVMEVMLENI